MELCDSAHKEGDRVSGELVKSSPREIGVGKDATKVDATKDGNKESSTPGSVLKHSSSMVFNTGGIRHSSSVVSNTLGHKFSSSVVAAGGGQSQACDIKPTKDGDAMIDPLDDVKKEYHFELRIAPRRRKLSEAVTEATLHLANL